MTDITSQNTREMELLFMNDEHLNLIMREALRNWPNYVYQNKFKKFILDNFIFRQEQFDCFMNTFYEFFYEMQNKRRELGGE